MFGKIFLEITSHCNLSCSFCPPTRRPRSQLSPELFDRLLARLEGQGKKLYFHLKGEPLIHPSLGRFLETAGQHGFSVSLTTNGTLVQERADELLAATNLEKLSISLHSHVGEAGLEAYWARVSAFLDRHRAAPRFPVSLRLWSRGSGGLPPETERLWTLVRERYPAAGGWEDSSTSYKSREMDRLVYLNQADRFEWPDPELPQDGPRGFCRGLGNQVGVLADGTVVPCCMDGEGRIALGNLATSSLEEILASPRARAIRAGFARRELVEPLCRTCGYRRRFDRRGLA
ncbi:MAG TPA: radical SAM protein [Rectinemataceae bacterium]|nr:radical SAM protein [Rectinemataceae bacterium]